MTKEEQERLADEYIEKHYSPTKENALRDMRLSQELHLTKNGKFYSMVANEYRDVIAEYGMYCKEEELERWLAMSQSLIDSISSMKDVDWLYDAWVVEATAKLMVALDGEVDWDRVSEIVSDQGHTVGTMSEVSQMLLDFSPMGVEFVEHMVKPRSIFNDMKGLKAAYNSERGRRIRQEKKQRKEMGGRLVNVLVKRENSLHSQGE